MSKKRILLILLALCGPLIGATYAVVVVAYLRWLGFDIGGERDMAKDLISTYSVIAGAIAGISTIIYHWGEE